MATLPQGATLSHARTIRTNPARAKITPVPTLLRRLLDAEDGANRPIGWDAIASGAADERAVNLAIDAGLIHEDCVHGPSGSLRAELRVTPAGEVAIARTRKPLPPGYVACACGLAFSPAEWAARPLEHSFEVPGGTFTLRSCLCGRPASRVVAAAEKEDSDEVPATLPTGQAPAKCASKPAARAKFADPDCYGCRGEGTIDGFGLRGVPCICVPTCEECGEGFAWDHDDAKPPKVCNECRACEVAS